MPTIHDLILCFFFALTLLGASMAALVRRALYAVFWLGLSLFGLATLFVILGSPFVGAMQLLIYIGGISVLLVFGVMLSVSMATPRHHRNLLKTTTSSITAGAFFIGMLRLIMQTDFHPAPGAAGDPLSVVDPARWAVARLGEELLTHYLLAFEALSLLLVIAIVGSILIAHKEFSKG